MARSSNPPARTRFVWGKTSEYRCAHCGMVTYRRTIDHYIPVGKGGGNDWRNLMPLCYSCNQARASAPVDPKEFYLYAHRWAIRACYRYRKQWESVRTNALGEVILHPYSIAEEMESAAQCEAGLL